MDLKIGAVSLEKDLCETVSATKIDSTVRDFSSLHHSEHCVPKSSTYRRSMQREECIYNLIPKVVVVPEKPKRYTSMHDPKKQPTASTFGLAGKTKLLGSNLGDEKPLSPPEAAKTFGTLNQKPDPKNFIKKQSLCKAPESKRRLVLGYIQYMRHIHRNGKCPMPYLIYISLFL